MALQCDHMSPWKPILGSNPIAAFSALSLRMLQAKEFPEADPAKSSKQAHSGESTRSREHAHGACGSVKMAMDTRYDANPRSVVNDNTPQAFLGLVSPFLVHFVKGLPFPKMVEKRAHARVVRFSQESVKGI